MAFDTWPAVRFAAVPSAFVKVTDCGVPKIGVIKVGEVEKTKFVLVVPVVPVALER